MKMPMALYTFIIFIFFSCLNGMAEDVILLSDSESRREEVLTFAQSSHDATVLNMMYDMYQNQQLTDVTINAKGDMDRKTSVKCHRNVLAATSPYFNVRTIKIRQEWKSSEHDMHNYTI